MGVAAWPATGLEGVEGVEVVGSELPPPHATKKVAAMEHEPIAKADDNARRLPQLKRKLMGNASEDLNTIHDLSFGQERNQAKYCSSVYIIPRANHSVGCQFNMRCPAVCSGSLGLSPGTVAALALDQCKPGCPLRGPGSLIAPWRLRSKAGA